MGLEPLARAVMAPGHADAPHLGHGGSLWRWPPAPANQGPCPSLSGSQLSLNADDSRRVVNPYMAGQCQLVPPQSWPLGMDMMSPPVHPAGPGTAQGPLGLRSSLQPHLACPVLAWTLAATPGQQMGRLAKWFRSRGPPLSPLSGMGAHLLPHSHIYLGS